MREPGHMRRQKSSGSGGCVLALLCLLKLLVDESPSSRVKLSPEGNVRLGRSRRANPGSGTEQTTSKTPSIHSSCKAGRGLVDDGSMKNCKRREGRSIDDGVADGRAHGVECARFSNDDEEAGTPKAFSADSRPTNCFCDELFKERTLVPVGLLVAPAGLCSRHCNKARRSTCSCVRRSETSCQGWDGPSKRWGLLEVICFRLFAPRVQTVMQAAPTAGTRTVAIVDRADQRVGGTESRAAAANALPEQTPMTPGKARRGLQRTARNEMHCQSQAPGARTNRRPYPARSGTLKKLGPSRPASAITLAQVLGRKLTAP